MFPEEERLKALMIRGMAGDNGAYRTLLMDLSGLLRAFFGRRLAGLPSEVEDLVQETLLAMHARRDTYDPQRPFTAWAYAIARYKMIDRLRGRARREALQDELVEGAFVVQPAVEASDSRRDLLALLDRLPQGQRVPIWMVKVEGASVAETAERTGMSQSNVKVAVHRGLRKLSKLVAGS